MTHLSRYSISSYALLKRGDRNFKMRSLSRRMRCSKSVRLGKHHGICSGTPPLHEWSDRELRLAAFHWYEELLFHEILEKEGLEALEIDVQFARKRAIELVQELERRGVGLH